MRFGQGQFNDGYHATWSATGEAARRTVAAAARIVLEGGRLRHHAWHRRGLNTLGSADHPLVL